jgi:hypothetical protein
MHFYRRADDAMSGSSFTFHRFTESAGFMRKELLRWHRSDHRFADSVIRKAQ